MYAIRSDHDIEPLFRPASEANVYPGAIVAQRVAGVTEPVATCRSRVRSCNTEVSVPRGNSM
jgi:hypothetical protein